MQAVATTSLPALASRSVAVRAKSRFAGAALPRAARPLARVAPKAVKVQAALASEEENDSLKEAGIAALRVVSGVMMIHNGLDKLVDPAGFAEFVVKPYLGLPAPLVCTYLAAYTELIASVTLTLGLFTRPSALALTGTMGAAIVFHLKASGLEGFPLGVVEKHQYAFEAAALYAAIYIYFAAAGGGKYSVDAAISKDE